MIEQLVGQFLGSADGKSALSELVGHGLNQQQATTAVTATAQGLASQLGGDGGNPLAALGGLLGGAGESGGNPLGALGGLLGGNSAGGALGAIGGLLGGAGEGGTNAGGGALGALGGLLGGASAGGNNPLAALLGGAGGNSPLNALAAPIANFVSEKTGLAPQLAQTVVGVVLPKVLAYFQSSSTQS